MARAKHWCFTINNYTDDEPRRILTKAPTPVEIETDLPDAPPGADPGGLQPPAGVGDSQIKYVVFQCEKGESGTPHIQGYISFHKTVRLGQVKRYVGARAHCEVARGSPAQNEEYCTKPDGRIAGPFRGGVPPRGQGARSDLHEFATAVLGGVASAKLAEDFPVQMLKYSSHAQALKAAATAPRSRDANITCYVIIGATGVGKTKYVYDWCENNNKGMPYAKSITNKWWDGYAYEPVVLFDDMSDDTTIPITEYLRIIDRYPHRVEIKGGHTQVTSTYFFFTSNTHPRDWFPKASENHLAAFMRRVTKLINFPVDESEDEED